jgi:hypothetical protein
MDLRVRDMAFLAAVWGNEIGEVGSKDGAAGRAVG